MVYSFDKLIESVKQVNWSFTNESSNGHITDLHPYPARFIPTIPKTIFKLLPSTKKFNVLDPFAGCGTTLVEGLEFGNNVVGIDVNSLAILLQNVYTHRYGVSDFEEFNRLSQKVTKSLDKKTKTDFTLTTIPNVDHWFNQEAKNVLYKVFGVINKSSNSDIVKDLIKFSISRILVRISNQESDTQYRAVNKNLEYRKIKDIIIKSLEEVHKRFRKFYLNRFWIGQVQVIHGDARESKTYQGVNKIDLIITSPPYPNAYEYWLYHKYRMFWLNMDPLWCRNREIGARPFYSGTGKMNENNFYEDMKKVLLQLHAITTEDALQFWVIGDSIIKGKLINNLELISSACRESGWQTITKIQREINRSRSSFQGIGRQKHEDILVIGKRK